MSLLRSVNYLVAHGDPLRSINLLGSFFLVTQLLMVAIASPTATAAENAQSLSPAALAATAQPLISPISTFARSKGFTRCAAELEGAVNNLLRNAEYSFRAFYDEKNSGSGPFSVLVDSRKFKTLERAMINITVSPIAPAPITSAASAVSASTRCSVMYEQTVYHNQRCERVQAEMASQAVPTAFNTIGAVTLEVGKNLTLTLIPVGNAQCITIIKEAAF